MPDYRKVARRKARKYGLDPGIFERQIQQESGFNPRARSPAGAGGIAQIMPATARGWGVDPYKPRQALDAAARNMAAYVKKYGSYENALRAYNAGPGAIERSKGFSETNHYVKTILGGRSPSTRGVRTTASGMQGGRPATVDIARQTTFDAKGYDQAVRRARVGQFLQQAGRGNSILFRSGLLGGPTPSPADFTQSRLVSSLNNAKLGKPEDVIKNGGKYVQAKGPQGQLAELFYDPLGGWDRPAGAKKAVSIGPIGGHGGHAHIGGDPKLMVQLGRMARKMGLSVRENPLWDPVDPVHTGGSLHYQKAKVKIGRRRRVVGKAIDVSGNPQALTAYTRAVMRMFNLR